MEVILLEKVGHLGAVGSTVKVKPGYFRNYLNPQGKAVMATKENIARVEAQRAELERKDQQLRDEAKARAEKLAALTVTLYANVAEEGKLYGSIGTAEVANAITQAGVPVKKSEVLMPMGPIRVAGEHSLDLRLHSDVTTTVKVIVAAQEAV